MAPGDVGNATTYPFPVLIREVKGLIDTPHPPLRQPDGSYADAVQKLVDAARQFELDGVRCIAGCCGFFSIVQPIVAAEVGIPVMMSPLMMIPVIHQMLPADRSVLVVTAAKKLLTDPFFTAVNVDRNDRVLVAGLEASQVFNAMCMGGTSISCDLDLLRDDVLALVDDVRKSSPEIGSILLECTTLPPLASDIREHTGLPVFDFVACVEWMHRAVTPRQYQGYI